MKNKILKIILVTILIVSVFIPDSRIVKGDLTADLKAAQARLASLQKKLDDLKGQIKANKNQRYNLMQLVGELNDQIEEAEDQIDDFDNRISSVQNIITEKAMEIGIKEQIYEQLKANQISTLNLLYHTINIDGLGLPFNGKDITDAYAASSSIKNIVNKIEDNMEKTEQEKMELEKMKSEQEAQKKELLALQNEVIKQKKLLDEQKSAKNELIYNLDQESQQIAADEEKVQSQISKENDEITAIIKEIQKLNPSTGVLGTIIMPFRIATHITDPYGWRIHPILHTKSFHHGVDLYCPSNTPLIAVADGTVIDARKWVSYGNMIMIEHAGGVVSCYAHMKSFSVKVGQVVKQGQMIGYSDSTGWSTGPHLHFELRINGDSVDPIKYLPKF
jgi:murein DD-endopeptidase MepM/ murein hydrolase activator NlpD